MMDGAELHENNLPDVTAMADADLARTLTAAAEDAALWNLCNDEMGRRAMGGNRLCFQLLCNILWSMTTHSGLPSWLYVERAEPLIRAWHDAGDLEGLQRLTGLLMYKAKLTDQTVDAEGYRRTSVEAIDLFRRIPRDLLTAEQILEVAYNFPPEFMAEACGADHVWDKVGPDYLRSHKFAYGLQKQAEMLRYGGDEEAAEQAEYTALMHLRRMIEDGQDVALSLLEEMRETASPVAVARAEADFRNMLRQPHPPQHEWEVRTKQGAAVWAQWNAEYEATPRWRRLWDDFKAKVQILGWRVSDLAWSIRNYWGK